MTEIQKRKKGQILNNSERQLILNLMHYLKEKNTGRSVSEIIREISKATGCSERTIYKIRKEASKGIVVAPTKTRLRKKENKNSRNVKYDSYVKSSIREKVHNYFLQNIAPTLNTILCLVNSDPNLPDFKRSTLHTLLKEIGFVYEQKGKKSLLTEGYESVKCRQEYLKDIKRFRSENRWIVYTGETLMSLIKNEIKKEEAVQCQMIQQTVVHPVVVDNRIDCEAVNSVIVNDSQVVTGATLVYTVDVHNYGTVLGDNNLDVNGALPSTVQDVANNTDNIPVHTILSTNSYLLGEPSNVTNVDPEMESTATDAEIGSTKIGREFRFIVMHAGSETGFLEGVEHVVLCKKRNEDIDNYEQWFINKLLPKVPPNSVIVVDNNAPYHKKKEENIPDGTWKKHQIKNWLVSKNVNVTEIKQKKDLLSAVNSLRSIYSTRQKIDELARQRGIILISLPPYHYELNPLNLVWAQVKCHVHSNMRSFKVKRIKQLVKEAFYAVPSINWMNCVHHVHRMEELLWTVDEVKKSDQANVVPKS